MPLAEHRRKARATLASHTARASRNPNDPQAAAAVTIAKRDYYATALEDYITKVVNEAPPLTDEQRSRLAVILRGGAR